MKKILISAYSEKGDIKQENQDSILCRSGKIGKHTVGLFIVADGCGGMENGSQISNFITGCFSRLWNTKLQEILERKHFKNSDIGDMLNDELEEINLKVREFGQKTNSRGGSTLSLLLIIDARYYIRNVGDSRIYLLRHRMTQLTTDQTLVAEMVRNKEITKEEAKKHKKRNVLSMCIGYFEHLRTFCRTGLVCRNDNFIICCDGLYNCLSEKEIKREVRRQSSKRYEELAVKLRGRIKAGAAKDNVSVITVRCKGWYW